MYRYLGQPRLVQETCPDVIAEAQAMADTWLPSPCCVMDTCLVGDDMKVVEFNCINASGFYDHDISLVLNKLLEYTNAQNIEE